MSKFLVTVEVRVLEQTDDIWRAPKLERTHRQEWLARIVDEDAVAIADLHELIDRAVAHVGRLNQGAEA